MVSNLTISTARLGSAAINWRAISSVCASAITLLRVPIRIALPATLFLLPCRIRRQCALISFERSLPQGILPAPLICASSGDRVIEPYRDNAARTKTMKIALAIFQLETLGGKERDCLAVATHLQQRGHDVILATTRATSRELPVAIIPREGLSNHGRARHFAKAVMAYRESQRPDLLLSFERVPGADFYYAADAAVALRMKGAKSFLPRQRTYLQLERGVFENPRARFFFLTEAQRDQYAAHYDFNSARGTVLPVILHDERFKAARAAAERSVTRAKLGLPLD